MQITDIEIARFGVWRDLTLPLAGPGLNLLYGPNEAGKTTLMRFVRGVLYGFEPFSTHGFRERVGDAEGLRASSTAGWDGTVHAEIDGAPHVLRRFSEPGGDPRGTLVVTDPDGETHGEEWLHARLGGLSETLYRNVYALGIYELQELATLEHEAVAEHVHGVSLGPAGRRFLRAADAAENEARGLLVRDDAGDVVGGRIADLLRERRSLSNRLAALPDGRAAAGELRIESDRLAKTAAKLERKKKRARQDLRGRRYAETVHGPWRQVRDLRAELNKLGGAAAVPPDGLTRLIAAEADRDAAKARAAETRARADDAAKRADAVTFDETLAEHAGAVRAVAGLGGWFAETRAARDGAATAADQFARRADEFAESSAGRPDRAADPADWSPEEADRFAARFAGGGLRQHPHFARFAAAAGADPDLADFAPGEGAEIVERVETREPEEVTPADDAPISERPADPPPLDLTRGPNGVDVSDAAEATLTGAAAAYRAAGLQARRLKRAYRKKDRRFRRSEARRAEALAAVGVEDPREAVAADDARVAKLAEVADLTRTENVLAGRGTAGGLRPDEWAQRLEVPPWVAFCFGLFAFGGTAFLLLGLWRGVADAALAGGIFLLIGLCCWGLGWKMRDHMEGVLSDAAVEAECRGAGADANLAKTRDRIRALAAAAGLDPKRLRTRGGVGNGEWDAKAASAALLQAERDRERLRSLADTADAHAKRRRDLTALRDRIRRSQGDLAAGRQMWFEALQTVGLPEGSKTKEALTAWREERSDAVRLAAAALPAVAPAAVTRVVEKVVEKVVRRAVPVPVPVPVAAGNAGAAEAKQARRAAEQAAARRDDLAAALDGFRRRVRAFGASIGRPEVSEDVPATLAAWVRELDAQADARRERDRRAAEADRLRAEADALEARAAAKAQERRALLDAAGVADRAAYERLAGGSAKRAEVAALLKTAEAELDRVAAGETEFAVQEEDLAAFDPAENRDAVAKLEASLEETEGELRRVEQRRAVAARELESLGADASRDAVKLDLSRVDGELRSARERWHAATLAGRAFAGMRGEVERTRQPAVLAAAGRYLEQLTGGRYRRVWSPLGERTLLVEDAAGTALAPDALSGGTREQLYLAIRLGLMDHVAEADENASGSVIDGNGLDLRPPVVLDDVLVNFDQLRTEAALDTLRTFCAEETRSDGTVRPARQVLFFTCHLHLAHLFESGGVDPVWLPHNRRGERFGDLTARPVLRAA